jgi:hypothetical protein
MDANQIAGRDSRRARWRAREVQEFWRIAPDWMERTGNSEEELLKRFPSFRGTKPAVIEHAPAPTEIHVVTRPGKSLAAGPDF